MKLKDLIYWDLLLALVLAVLLGFILPDNIDNSFASTIYGVGISVLSIIFSVFFAALAIIISSGDNDFIHFLEENGDYSIIINSFRFSLILLFISLIVSIIMFVITSLWQSNNIATQPKIVLALFTFIFSYSLFVTANSSLDALKYAERRVIFIRKTRGLITDSEKSSRDTNKSKPIDKRSA
jgi:K+-sensing histidine kinase KdpD